MAERVVERVDEAIKADVMHWAAIYVSHIFVQVIHNLNRLLLGSTHAHWEQEDISFGSLGRKGNEYL